MERNRLILLILFLLTFGSVILGIANLAVQSTNNKYSKTTNSRPGLFTEEEVGAMLIRVEGEIHSGESSYDSTGAETLLEQLRALEDSPNIKGILLEINSPGGSVAASQEVFQELLYLKKTKKIVVSMKDMAASGGYYIASAGDFIFAEPGTITGSIGVIAITPNLKGFLDKHGVEVKTYKAGKYKDMMSMFRNSTDEEDQLIQKLLGETYRRFVEDVALGRNRTVSSVEELAEGRIYSGEDAFRNKMVDALGGRREALAKLSELCQYEGTIPLFEEKLSPIEKFLSNFGAKWSGSFGTHALNRKAFQPGVYVIHPSFLPAVGSMGRGWGIAE